MIYHHHRHQQPHVELLKEFYLKKAKREKYPPLKYHFNNFSAWPPKSYTMKIWLFF